MLSFEGARSLFFVQNQKYHNILNKILKVLLYFIFIIFYSVGAKIFVVKNYYKLNENCINYSI